MLPEILKIKRLKTKCTNCGKKFVHSKLKPFTGAQGDCSVTFSKLSVLECPSKHERGYPYIKFTTELLHNIFNSQKSLPALKKTGYINKKDTCHYCGNIIIDPEIQPCKFKMKIELRYIDPFNVEIVAPSLECASCGLVQVSQRSHCDTIVDAMLNGFKKMQISLR